MPYLFHLHFILLHIIMYYYYYSPDIYFIFAACLVARLGHTISIQPARRALRSIRRLVVFVCVRQYAFPGIPFSRVNNNIQNRRRR